MPDNPELRIVIEGEGEPSKTPSQQQPPQPPIEPAAPREFKPAPSREESNLAEIGRLTSERAELLKSLGQQHAEVAKYQEAVKSGLRAFDPAFERQTEEAAERLKTQINKIEEVLTLFGNAAREITPVSATHPQQPSRQKIEAAAPREAKPAQSRDEANLAEIGRLVGERSELLKSLGQQHAEMTKYRESVKTGMKQFDPAFERQTKEAADRLKGQLNAIEQILTLFGNTARTAANPQAARMFEAFKAGGVTHLFPKELVGYEEKEPDKIQLPTVRFPRAPLRMDPDWRKQRARELSKRHRRSVRREQLRAERNRIKQQNRDEKDRARESAYMERIRKQRFRTHEIRPLRHAAVGLQFAGMVAPAGGRFFQAGSLVSRGAAAVASTAMEAGATSAAVSGIIAAGAAAASAAAALGLVAAAAYKLNDILDQQVQRYGFLAPKTAIERGRVAGEGIMRDIERARKLDDVMSQYVRAQFELGQSIENLKASLTNAFGPKIIELVNVLTRIADMAGRFMPDGEKKGDNWAGKVGGGIWNGLKSELGISGINSILYLIDWLSGQAKDKKLAVKTPPKGDWDEFERMFNMVIPGGGGPPAPFPRGKAAAARRAHPAPPNVANKPNF